ncbi:uncharacterized protein CTRU02_204863 [Colletotrichum truncatum]|uniref:Uncharacterized protein n=1 Tax=Colletotrichum truncatum TaxID=5467 RepID=A0ACC3ZDA8_COLTU|nr:uncharacterized protein CTRU02_03097 [Colletotrichum truncatum]KAF6798055.1 hypothetical protein CTRU02_03097 [Colletotrichum truncatum]
MHFSSWHRYGAYKRCTLCPNSAIHLGLLDVSGWISGNCDPNHCYFFTSTTPTSQCTFAALGEVVGHSNKVRYPAATQGHKTKYTGVRHDYQLSK